MDKEILKLPPIENINLNYVRNLIDQGLIADINIQLEDKNLPMMQPTLLHISIYNSDEELFDYLIEKNADINKSFETFGSPLYLAVTKSSSNLNILRKLIERGARINVREFMHNWTPLHLACYYGKCEVAELLINCGADINMSNLYLIKNPTANIGITPLHLSIERDQIRMVELLCRKNVDTNQESISRGTPLVYAILKGKIDIVKILVKYVKVAPNFVTDLMNAGADINTCIDNKTIIEYCLENNASKEVIEVINQHIVKLRAAKLYVNNKIILTDNYSELNYMCLEELELMKKTRIGTNTISVYDTLGSLNDLSYKITYQDGSFVFNPKFLMIGENIVWSPFTEQHINSIEKVQWIFSECLRYFIWIKNANSVSDLYHNESQTSG
ncbi:putative ankyrin repeat protein RF_0381 [Microplitis mediator]|uniref:putative ankyrin repeat protein RF_0381 n=1 Tax=Microplitis mediator TaxID=375433 RepID=UPI0025521731|nr:putative ankyrin repeat protein RF_0381 [Microplitis mediator]